MFGSKGNKAKELKTKADQAYADQKWKKALELYLDALGSFMEDPRVLQRIGDLHRRLKDNQQAVEAYKQVAAIYTRAGFWAKAIAINKIILEIDPADTEVQRKLAEMYSKQGSQGQAIPGISSAPSIAKRLPYDTEPEAIPLSEDSSPSSLGAADHMIGSTVSIDDGTASVPGAGVHAHPDAIEIAEETEEVPQVGSSLGTPVPALSQIPLLSDMSPDELFAVLGKLAVRKYPVGAFVCEEGDIGRSMYIIAEGQVEVFVRDKDGTLLVLCRLRGGDFFGEFGLLTNGQRNATVQAKTEVELLEMTAHDLDTIAANHPRVWVVLEEYLRKRVVDTILRKSEVFRALTEAERTQMQETVELRKFPMDSVVMKEGTEGDEMFFVKAGTLLVSVGEGQSRVVVGELEPGDYFGDVAMLTGRPRSATVRAKGDCELYALSRIDAARIFRSNHEILSRLKQKMEARTRENQEVYQSFEEARKTLDLV